ncbi:MAG: hypothetical protein IKG19_03900 [Lachnospiraceae bacterium]|nr:hypothetical protein [Lachnospiraceae bacterium]
MILCRPVEQTGQSQLYRIKIPEDKNNTVYYCRERLEQNIRDFIGGMKAYELKIVLDELKKEGVIIPS